MEVYPVDNVQFIIMEKDGKLRKYYCNNNSTVDTNIKNILVFPLFFSLGVELQ